MLTGNRSHTEERRGTRLHPMRVLPVILLALLASAQAEVTDVRAWETLVVQDSGRRKPMGTFGREVLVKLSGHDAVTAKDGTKADGTEFTFDMLYALRDWGDEPILLVSYHPLVEQIGLDASRKHFSRRELADATHLTRLAGDAAALRQAGQPVPRLNLEAQTVLGRLQLFDAVSSTAGFLLTPPPPGSKPGAAWLSVDQLAVAYPPEKASPILQDLRAVNVAYREGNNADFAAAAGRLQSSLRSLNPDLYVADSEEAPTSKQVFPGDGFVGSWKEIDGNESFKIRRNGPSFILSDQSGEMPATLQQDSMLVVFSGPVEFVVVVDESTGELIKDKKRYRRE